MLKITIQLSVLCLLCWNAQAAKCISQIQRFHTILKGQKIFRCGSLHQTELVDELKGLKHDFQPNVSINLFLYHIDFKQVNSDGMPKMTNGWLNITLSNLKWLQLREINVLEIEAKAFSHAIFHELEYLEIFNVPLRILKFGMFDGLDKLKTLSLYGLQLDVIQKDILRPIITLEGFSIINCGLKKISLDNLFGAYPLPRLRIIGVQKCDLSDTITEQTFTSVPALYMLALKNDQIDTIGPNSFSSVLNTVKYLSLGWNKLKSIPNDLFKTHRAIKIDLSHNPWHCDCQMEHLRIIEQTIKSGIICATPKKFNAVLLRNCPPLCTETTTIITATEAKLTTEQQTTIENGLTAQQQSMTEHQSSAEQQSREHPEQPEQPEQTTNVAQNQPEKPLDTIDVMCEIFSPAKVIRTIKLTKPSHKTSPVFRIEKGELHIDTVLLLNGFKLIELNHVQSKEFNDVVFNNENTCATYSKRDGSMDIKIKRKFERNALYRYCWIEESSKKKFPFDCVTFHSDAKKKGSIHSGCDKEDSDAWITVSSKPIMIIVCASSTIFAPVIGILIAVVLAKLFPKKIRGQKQDLKRFVSNLTQNTTCEDQAGLKSSNNSVCRHGELSKLTRPVNRMSKHVANFEGMEPDYITIDEIPPPLPPRTKMIISSNDKFNCCDSDSCTCYCEL